MMQNYNCIDKKVEVDECPGCAGTWLDFGELLKIRSQFSNEEQRKKAADKYIDDVFLKNQDFQTMRQESKEKLGKARRFANFFRFFCPSYYIDGDQDWGAF